MVDLETTGSSVRAGILSIGAVAFSVNSPYEDWPKYYSGPIRRDSCRSIQLVEDDDTLFWWAKQSESARKILVDSETGISIDLALMEFGKFVSGSRLWGNGADFDNAILANAYRAVKSEVPWKFWDNRCYRTMKNIFYQIPQPIFVGVKHSALDDAIHQARHLVEILKYLNKRSQ